MNVRASPFPNSSNSQSGGGNDPVRVTSSSPSDRRDIGRAFLHTSSLEKRGHRDISPALVRLAFLGVRATTGAVRDDKSLPPPFLVLAFSAPKTRELSIQFGNGSRLQGALAISKNCSKRQGSAAVRIACDPTLIENIAGRSITSRAPCCRVRPEGGMSCPQKGRNEIQSEHRPHGRMT
jgi:hypothetical protein